jgi:hypothetical protein
MKRILKTLCKTTGIGLVSGLIFGVALGNKIYQDAVERVHQLPPPPNADGLLCAAGKAPIALGILGIPAGALFGLILGGALLLYMHLYGSNRLP